MNNFPSFAAIITAAGKSERFNRNQEESVKKEYLKIDGHTVLYRATEPFFEIPGLAAVCITCPEGSEDETLIALEDLADINTIPFLIIPGGKTRKESVSKALNALRSFESNIEYVAIHDGARPFITPELIIIFPQTWICRSRHDCIGRHSKFNSFSTWRKWFSWP